MPACLRIGNFKIPENGIFEILNNAMFHQTHNEITPWHVVKADNKKSARLNIIRHIISNVECPDKDEHVATPDADVVFTYSKKALSSGVIEP